MYHYNYHTKYPECPFIYDFKNPYQKLDYEYQELTKQDCHDKINILLDDHAVFDKESVINFIERIESSLNTKYFIIEQNLDRNKKDQFVNFFTSTYHTLFNTESINQKFQQQIKYSIIPLFYDDDDSIIKINNQTSQNKRNQNKRNRNQTNRNQTNQNQTNRNNKDIDKENKKDIVEVFEQDTIDYKVNRKQIVIPNKFRGSLSKLRSSLVSESKQRRLKLNPHMINIQKKLNLSIKGMSDKIKVRDIKKNNLQIFNQNTEMIEIRNINGKYIFYPPNSGRIYVENITNSLSFISILQIDSNLIITLHKINYKKN
jgi:hypothetical protein